MQPQMKFLFLHKKIRKPQHNTNPNKTRSYILMNLLLKDHGFVVRSPESWLSSLSSGT